MTVIKRLRRLTGEAMVSPGEVPAPGRGGLTEGEASRRDEMSRAGAISALRRRIDAVLSRRPGSGPGAAFAASPRPEPGRPRPLEEVLAGEEIVTAQGRFFCAGSAWGMTHRHGGCCLGDLSPLDMAGVAILANDASLAGLDFRRGIFLDTETTGLAGGAGTVAFLIGLGWFADTAFVVKQLFMRDYSEERAALLFLRELMADRQFLVTFNGKAFDVNLLAGRFILNRLADPLSGLPHLDLLHPARRLLKHRLENVRLGTLEGEILGLEREGDVPGYEIPQRYFDWLRCRDGRSLDAVFQHNSLDVLSMVSLTAHLTELVGGKGAAIVAGPPPTRGDLLAAARLCLHRGDTARAQGILTELRRCSCPITARQAAVLLSLVHKRTGEWSRAVGIWQGMLAQDLVPNSDTLFPLLELAKWYEHRAHDYREALNLACRAMELLPPGDPAGEAMILQRRIARLERRLARQDQQPA